MNQFFINFVLKFPAKRHPLKNESPPKRAFVCIVAKQIGYLFDLEIDWNYETNLDILAALLSGFPLRH